MKRVSAPGVPSINCFYVLIQTHSITASKFARLCIPSVSPNSLDHRLQGHLQTRSITASKVHTSMVFQVHISTLTRSQPPSVSPNSLYYGLQVRMIMASKCISTLPRLPSRSASLSSLLHSLQVYLEIRSITAFRSIAKLARSRPRSVSLNSHNPHFLAHLEFALKHHTCSQSRYTVSMGS